MCGCARACVGVCVDVGAVCVGADVCGCKCVRVFAQCTARTFHPGVATLKVATRPTLRSKLEYNG
jgi:hypothetical protein